MLAMDCFWYTCQHNAHDHRFYHGSWFPPPDECGKVGYGRGHRLGMDIDYSVRGCYIRIFLLAY